MELENNYECLEALMSQPDNLSCFDCGNYQTIIHL